LVKKEKIIIVDEFDENIETDDLDKRDAWTILTLHNESSNRTIEKKH